MQKMMSIIFCLSILSLMACNKQDDPPKDKEEMEEEMEETTEFIRGADLSYVNEMLDCGATYSDATGEKDPYVIFSEAGTDLVRVRLWHTPGWTDYSNYADVKKTIQKAKAEGMEVLLDFHYSDDWADPGKQKVPSAWQSVVNNTQLLGDSLYNYTYRVLSDLNAEGLLPEMVQVGNETNSDILQDPNGNYGPINWTRNATLFNRGIKAVRDASADFNQDIEVMLHIAQPENALWFFQEATQNGLTNYDWIGISYYPVWSDYSLAALPGAIETLVKNYQKRLMVLETAYPFTMNNKDAANNILGSDALIDGYPASEQGQFDYLVALEEAVVAGGGEGIIYWEPAWVSTGCSTQWGQGSHWDNATLFNHSNKATIGMGFYSRK